MCNRKRNTIARSPRIIRNVDSENLAPAYVAVADPIDGLIMTSDLEQDVAVEVTVWFGATQGDIIRLFLDGVIVGDEYELGSNPVPGSTVTLTIPITTQLKSDGTYSLKYRVEVFPGGNLTLSPETVIRVDRTPPGAHQLGYMDFPEEAKDGLTAAELATMNDKLTGRIYGYAGLTKGDVISTFWGESAGPEVVLTADEDGSRPINVDFEKGFLQSVEISAGPTYYIVKDRAGNISLPSKMITIPLFLTEIISDLPPPVVDDADGIINRAEAQEGVIVKIPTSTMLIEGDSITLRWGNVLLGPVAIEPDDISAPFVLYFDIDLQTIEQAGDGPRQLRYEVVRDGRVVGVSTNLEVTVYAELPVAGSIAKPTIKGGSSSPSAEDNVIDESDFELNASVFINWNPDFAAGQVLNVYWGGVEVLAAPYTVTNSDVAAARTIVLTAMNEKFRPVGTGNDIRVAYTISAIGNPNTSISDEQSITVISADELPGGPDGADAPEFTQLNANGAINDELSINGAPVYIKPYENMAAGQVITFLYEGYDDLVAGNLKTTWTHISPSLTEESLANGYSFTVPRNELVKHCYGHAEATFKVQGENGIGNSKRVRVYVDMRHAGVCAS